jgi:hypothetical protein
MITRPRGYTAIPLETGYGLRHDESGIIFTGFRSPDAAYLSVELIEEDLQIDSDERCACGCGEIVKPGSRFRQGHDARLKGQLLRDAKRGLPIAITKLRAYGWLRFLDSDTMDRHGIGYEEAYES